MTGYPNIELRHHYDDELDEIRRSIIEMGTLVLTNVERAGVVITESRLDEVDEVRAADLPVNDRYRSCEEKVFQVLDLVGHREKTLLQAREALDEVLLWHRILALF